MTKFDLKTVKYLGYKRLDCDALALGLSAALDCKFFGGAFGDCVYGYVREEMLEAAHAAACRLMDQGIVEEYTTDYR